MSREKKAGKRLTKSALYDMVRDFFRSQPEKTFSFKQVFRELRLTTHPQKMLAIDVMEELAWDDFLSRVSDNAYRLNLQGQVQEGTFVRKNNGKNSVIPDGSDKPIFVSERNSMYAMNGDHVRFSLYARRRHHIKEALVTEILAHARDTFVGKILIDNDVAFLVTDNNIFASDILIPRRKLKDARDGDKAVVKVIEWPSKDSKKIIGEVVDVLGKTGDNTAEMHAILAQYGLPYRYPKAVEAAANSISAEITEADLAGREDFRPVWTCTIDPHDAKDFDDALSIRTIDDNPDGTARMYEVGVHIADVSHYVKEGSIIDKEAQQRATSVYLVDRTIPMLPERLCNYICSLRPDEDKLCYSVIFNMDDEANVKDYRIVHTVIRSNRRYAYEQVQELLERNGVVDGTGQPAPPPGKEGYQGENAAQLVALDRLAKKLRQRRFVRGGVDFDGEELRFDIDEQGKPVGCYYKRSKDANKLIEEFMLLANRTVAEDIGKPKGKHAKGKKPQTKTLPYRIHDNPDPQKLEELREFVARFGYKLKSTGSKGAAVRSLNQLMADCAGSGREKLIQRITLKAMMKAKYSTHNIGHFGLAFDYYTHFTSPIRRYPDTMVHRLLTRYQQGAHSADRSKYEELCKHSSEMEQIAANAERDSIKYKMVEYMADKIGQTFDAHISGIQSYGIYCEIDENHCEGLVPIRELGPDYYDFDEKNYRLIGRRRHHSYQLGDAIRITVDRANVEKRQLNFTIAE